MGKILRRFSKYFTLGALALSSVAVAEQALLVDQGVLVEVDPDPESPAYYANYISNDGWVVTSTSFVDVAVMVFDFGDVEAVSSASLSLPLESFVTQGTTLSLELVAFPDDGAVDIYDYTSTTLIPVAEFNPVTMAGGDPSAILSFDVTGAVNANLPFSRYVAFRVKNTAAPEDVCDDCFPGYNGVKFRPLYSLEYSTGGAPVLPADRPRFDGYTLSIPSISVPGLGVYNVQMNLIDPFTGLFELTEAADISSPGYVSGAGLTGTGLLSCENFSAPRGSQALTPGAPNLALSSGLLDIPSVIYDGIEYSLQLSYVPDSLPLLFGFESLEEVTSDVGSSITISQFGGSLVTEPSQDFIPLCHGWVLIGDTSNNALVERNVITGETGATYKFNTIPDELLLDDNNGIVYLSTHPESERLYQLDLNSGSYTHHRLEEGGRDFIPRDIALGEDGNVFVLLFDALYEQEEDGPSEHGLWMGIFNSDGEPEVPARPLILPVRIEYDSVQKHVFLTTESNLVTFEFDTDTQEMAFVEGTDIPVGSGCTDFSISPDGNRLAYSCPEGNEMSPHTSIVDIDPLDYYDTDGEWYLDASPVSATFDASGEVLIATDNQKLYFFDAETHLLHSSYALGLQSGESVNKIRMSRDGEFVLILMEADINAESGKIYWLPLPSFSPM